MTHLTRRSFVGAAALLAAPALIRPSFAADPVKLGCLFSSSGTMANLEGRLNHVVRMAADEINGRGGVNGRQIEVLTSDPASDWPAALLAANATIVCRGPGGTREIAARDFFQDTFQTAIEPTEVLMEIRIGGRIPGAGRKAPRRMDRLRTQPSAQQMAARAQEGIGQQQLQLHPFRGTQRRRRTGRVQQPRDGARWRSRSRRSHMSSSKP